MKGIVYEIKGEYPGIRLFVPGLLNARYDRKIGIANYTIYSGESRNPQINPDEGLML